MIKYFDMFSGIGGFRAGFSKIDGMECIGHCEIDKFANKSYNAIFDTEGECYFEDATKLNPNEVPDFDLVCAGFPCQPYAEVIIIPKFMLQSL
jgi:DNA (cytosine-5)-methyltransferase 1